MRHRTPLKRGDKKISAVQMNQIAQFAHAIRSGEPGGPLEGVVSDQRYSPMLNTDAIETIAIAITDEWSNSDTYPGVTSYTSKFAKTGGTNLYTGPRTRFPAKLYQYAVQTLTSVNNGFDQQGETGNIYVYNLAEQYIPRYSRLMAFLIQNQWWTVFTGHVAKKITATLTSSGSGPGGPYAATVVKAFDGRHPDHVDLYDELGFTWDDGSLAICSYMGGKDMWAPDSTGNRHQYLIDNVTCFPIS